MSRELLVRVGEAPPQRRRLECAVTLGGSRADGVLVPGLPAAAIRLEPRATGVVIAPAVPGARVACRAVAAGERRLLRPGERAVYREVALELPDAAARAGPGSERAAAAALLRAAAAGALPPRGPQLVVLTGPRAGTPIPLGADVVLGRGRGATLRLDDPAASRRHARVRLDPQGATVEDLGSKNGLRVNGVRVERRVWPLRAGDTLTVGETELALEAGAGEQAPHPPPPAPPAPSAPRPRVRGPLLLAGALALAAVALALAGACQ